MRNLILSVFLLWSPFVCAAELVRLKMLFIQSFWNKYEDRKAVKNIENFLREAIQQGIDINGAELVQVKNQGIESYGLISAFQARDIKFSSKEKGNVVGYSKTPMSWTSHAFLLIDNKVFDFDFRNQPTVLEVGSYINEMFIPKVKHNNNAFRESKLGNYFLEFYLVRSESVGQGKAASGDEFFIKSRNLWLSKDLKEWFLPKEQYGRRCVNYYLSISENR